MARSSVVLNTSCLFLENLSSRCTKCVCIFSTSTQTNTIVRRSSDDVEMLDEGLPAADTVRLQVHAARDRQGVCRLNTSVDTSTAGRERRVAGTESSRAREAVKRQV